MARPATEAQALEYHRREQAGDGDALVDMCLKFQLGDDPKTIMRIGGRWDRRMEDFVGDAESAVLVKIHPGQMRAVEWFRSWIAKHVQRRGTIQAPAEDGEEIAIELDEVYSALFAGGRRGGKTWIAAAICAAYAIAFPDAIVWVVNPSRGKDDTKPDEVRRYMARLLDPAWLTRETAGGWELINGSVIQMKSAHVGSDPDAIKEGQVDLAWLNEGQKMVQRVYTVARAAIADKSGLVLVCANPPVEAKDQQWVSDFAADASIGRRASVYLDFNPLDNPYIDRRALQSLASEVDERTYAIEVLGQFRGPIDAVAYNWQRIYNERAAPSPHSSLRDVTEEFMRLCEEGEGFTDVIGADMQVLPYIGGPVYRFFCPIDKMPTRDNVIAWIVGEVVLQGDELDWCAALKERGFKPASTLIICDATAEYQHTRRRSTDTPPPEWSGKGSYDLIKECGYLHIVPPSRRMRKKNPAITDRIRSFTSMISTAKGVRRLFCDDKAAPNSAKAIRNWRTVHGKPSRSMDEAHLGDGISYPLIRLFPRIWKDEKPGSVDKITQRVDRPTRREDLLPERPRRVSKRDRYRGM